MREGGRGEEEARKRETKVRRVMIEGVGGHVGDESSPSLFFFFHDGLKWCLHNVISVPCCECQSAVNSNKGG